MKNRLTRGFIAGATGAIILAVIMYLLKAMGMGEPGFVLMYRGAFGAHPPMDQAAGAIIFIISGGIWGIIYAMLIKHATIINGMLFGLLPTIWLWTVVNTYLGKPLFNGFEVKGLLMPILFNVVIWGSYMGLQMRKRNRIRV
ncbi:MAG: hypothetical protein ACSLE0_18130 [Chitinophagaceae bacterium]